MTQPAFLAVANFSDYTGYAWHNIYRLFKDISKNVANNGMTPLVSFAQIEGTANDYFDSFAEKLQLDPDLSQAKNVDRLIEYVKQYNIQYIYLTDQPSTSPAYAKLRKAGVKKILSHCRVSVANPFYPEPESIVKQTAKFLYSRLPTMTVDKVICVSDFVKYRLQHKAKVPASRLVTVPNGVETKRFYSEPRPVVNGEPITLFTSGRATAHKGIRELIEAVAIVNQRTAIPFTVRYAGDGPEIDAYKALVEKHSIPNFAFLGQLPSVEQEIHNAHVLVMPSAWGDAFPSAVTESLASGRPLITTKAGGIPEIVGSPDNAMLVQPGDVNELADAILHLLTHPEKWNTIAEGAYHHVTNRYTLANYYGEVWNVISQEINH
ncbi:glycosyltransferase family 4 protein [Salinimonas chungwhensis]|uniref:glycosyltransferase family 4 protein n=1 Tax=Salinimonas chungwhensis TaxID=265425 RepID=UPI00036DE653|nr:glycosyltransferase family 4 protein [Salinimonas chungwhensis]